MAREAGMRQKKYISTLIKLIYWKTWIFFFKFSGQKALSDAGVTYDKIEQAYVGYVYGIT